jgi:ADP-ribose pyrophosphatase YjhB (NUDIX family)
MSDMKPESVVACLVDKDGLFLLVKETKSGDGGFNLPSGRVEAGELLSDAAMREVKEETGFEVELTGVVGFYQSIYEDVNLSGPVYLAVITGGHLTPSDAHPEVIWASEEDIVTLDEEGKLRFKYIPLVFHDFKRRGIYPLDIVSEVDYSSNS